MALCLFCDSELDESTKPEHILLNALGGRKTTTKAVCSTCNNTFGSTIDYELALQVIEIRNLYGPGMRWRGLTLKIEGSLVEASQMT